MQTSEPAGPVFFKFSKPGATKTGTQKDLPQHQENLCYFEVDGALKWAA